MAWSSCSTATQRLTEDLGETIWWWVRCRTPSLVTRSYAGQVRASRLMPWKLKCSTPDPVRPTPCDTINGNLVLIPRALAPRLGNIDPGFAHAFGDLDYGFRARKAGARLWVAPGFAGRCAPNVSRPRYKRPGPDSCSGTLRDDQFAARLPGQGSVPLFHPTLPADQPGRSLGALCDAGDQTFPARASQIIELGSTCAF